MAPTPETFDPYLHWLGIPPTTRPLHHYLLLGLETFEADPARITAAADQRMTLIRQYQSGPRGAFTHKLLNDLATARICLLSPAHKAAYDQALHQALYPPVPTAAAPAPRRRKLEEVMPPGWTGSEPPLPPPVAPVAAVPSYQHYGEETEAAPVKSSSSKIMVLSLGAMILLVAIIGGAGMWLANQPAQADRDRPVVATQVGEEVDPSEIKSDSVVPVNVEAKAVETRPTPDFPNKAVVLMQEGSGEVNLSPATAALTGQVTREVVGTSDVLSQWISPNDIAEWQFNLVKPGFFELELQYTAGAAIRGKQANVILDDETKRFSLRESDGEGKLVRDSHIVVLKRSGKHKLSLHPAQPWAEGAWQLSNVRLVPATGP
ncbi:hypothetical protein ETAA8_21040 [Anatilimnocola aggregata]|uniref:Uncharacterized protein n=1 Tax=Anatilimnocola aggregata TaxID=2528021 RepID=A0A517Y9W3_9BACT|nr:hypothetical protein [Anatilimnocola aggregata]QDU27020.1 hypothetical protein ETAA8_21040 [Anatilimnocola aggregata]